jgi:hypothetical protein
MEKCALALALSLFKSVKKCLTSDPIAKKGGIIKIWELKVCYTRR